MISTNDFHTGLTIEIDGEVYQVVDFKHSKSGRGSAFVRTKLKNMEEGYVINKTFRANEKVPRAHVDKREMQYLYWDDSGYVFMDTERYNQITLSKEQIGDKINYIKENMNIYILMHEGTPLDIDLPTFVELKVADTPPGIKGDTVSGGTKTATMETGLKVKVPLFINEGDIIKIDTRTDEYIERVESN